MSSALLGRKWVKQGIGLAIAGTVASSAMYTVDGGERAVIFDKFSGVKQYVIGEGTHFLIPFVQRAIIYDIRSKPRNVPVLTGSKDMQNVNITLRCLHRPKTDRLPALYQNLGVDYEERVLPSITNEVLKAVVAQYNAAELITQREVVSQKVSEDLSERASNFGIIMDDISLTHLSFGKDFTNAVELKQVAQQEAERARYQVEKAEQNKKAAIIVAEGDNIAANLVSKAFLESGEGLIELRKLEAAEFITQNLSKVDQSLFCPLIKKFC